VKIVKGMKSVKGSFMPFISFKPFMLPGS